MTNVVHISTLFLYPSWRGALQIVTKPECRIHSCHVPCVVPLFLLCHLSMNSAICRSALIENFDYTFHSFTMFARHCNQSDPRSLSLPFRSPHHDSVLPSQISRHIFALVTFARGTSPELHACCILLQ